MDSAQYVFKDLESTYGKFIAPAFVVTVGGTKIDSTKVPISSLSVDINCNSSAGGCNFTIESQYDYANGVWKNDILDTIQIGAKIAIEAGYVTKKRVFFGFVDEYSVDYSDGAAPSITVTGIDGLGYLMHAKGTKFQGDKTSKEVVTELLNGAKNSGYADAITIGEVYDFKAQLIKEEKIDDFRFLCRLAEKCFMNFFVVNGEIVFDSLMSKTTPIITLTLGVSLMSFSKRFAMRDQVGNVTIESLDPLTHEALSATVTSTSISGTGDTVQDKVTALKSTEYTERMLMLRTQEECQKMAQAKFDNLAFGYISGEGKCIGVPDLIPGRYIELDGMKDGTADKYFITKVSHKFSGEGYYTSFSVGGAKSQ